MRVGLVIYGDLTTVSGGYLYDRQLVEHLRRRDDHVEIFSQEPRTYVGNLIRDNMTDALVESVRDARLDVLLQDELNHASLLAVNNRLKGRMGPPIVSIVHHLRSSEDRPRWQNALTRRLERTYLRSVDGFIFNGETTKSTVATVAGVSEPSVIAVPAGNRLTSDITGDEIRGRCLRSGPLNVVFLGSAIPRKGLHTLLTALASLPHRDWTLSVIGRLDIDERYTAGLRQQISSAGVFENVTLYGTLPDREISRLLRNADVLAIPSSYEGYGIAYLEGMAFGLPAIATTSGAAHEIITHEQNGWLIAPGDAPAIREILIRIRDDREMLIQRSLAAQERFLAHPEWETSMSHARDFLVTMTGAD